MKQLLLFLLTPLCIISMDAPLPAPLARKPVTDADLEAFRANWKKEATERAQAKKAQGSSSDKVKNSFNPPTLHTVTTDASLSSCKPLDKIPLFKAVIDGGREAPKTSLDSLENPFENDGKLISFLDCIRCGIIEVKEDEVANQICLHFRDHTSHTVIYTASLFQAQTAVRYASIFGQLIHLQKSEEELKRAQATQQGEPDKYPGLPARITALSQQIENLKMCLNKAKKFPDLSAYPDTEFFESQNRSTDSEDVKMQTQIALNKLADIMKSEKKLCRISLDRFYSFWAQKDLQFKQTYNDAKRNLEQIKKKRTLFFQSLENADTQQLLTIPSSHIIKKASRSTITFVNKLREELQNFDPNKGSPHNSDDEIW